MDFDNATLDFSEFDKYNQRKAAALFAKQYDTEFVEADEPDFKLAEHRNTVLTNLQKERELAVPDEGFELNQEILGDLDNNIHHVEGVKRARAQAVFDKIRQGNNDLTYEDFKVYDEYAGELRKDMGGEMSIMNFIGGAFDTFKKGFEDLGTGISDVHKDGEYWKVATSLLEGGARDQRELWGSIWHSKNKDSWAYGVKQFLTGADTLEERWGNFSAAQEFSKQTNRYLLVFKAN